jgi:phosphoribosylformylglycinamidine synthase
MPVIATATTGMTFRARITVRLSRGVNDPQGNAVAESLRSMGHPDVRDVRVGRVIDLLLDAPDDTAAKARVDELCRMLLANPVIETWEVDVIAAGSEGADGVAQGRARGA